MMNNVYVPGVTFEVSNSGKINIGAWLFAGDRFYAECSGCGESLCSKPSNYCPSCGALMINAGPSRKYYDEKVEELMQGVENKNV